MTCACMLFRSCADAQTCVPFPQPLPRFASAGSSTPVLVLPPRCAVTIYCITSPTVRSVEVKKIAGRNWEAAVAESGIRGLSKPRQQAAAAAAEGAAAADAAPA